MLQGELEGGYYVRPTVFMGHNQMRIFPEEIFGPMQLVATFKEEEKALAISNDTLYVLGAGVWSRDMNAGSVWGAVSWLAAYGPIATTLTRRMQHSGPQKLWHLMREPQDDA